MFLVRSTRARLAFMSERPFFRRSAVRENRAGRAEASIVVNGELVGLVAVPPGRPAPMAALRPLGPTLLASGLVLLITGAGAASLLIFGPVRRRLRQLEDAATRIGAGDATARAAEGGGDEVTALAKSFNRMAVDLQARATALSVSDQARRQLLADVSHELMTPLTAMRGYLETLAMSELQLDAPTRERYLGVVEQETRRMERIVGDLLDLARLEGGGLALKREFVDISALFERVSERHHRELTERDVRLVSSVDPAARVTGDPDRLEQALQNLAANALRHTPDGGDITLSAEQAGSHVRLSVRDNGPGIAPEHVPLIFDRFYKADVARAAGGSGLGLSIVKAIVERHGGTISVRNDSGAVFEILLPRNTSAGQRSGKVVYNADFDYGRSTWYSEKNDRLIYQSAPTPGDHRRVAAGNESRGAGSDGGRHCDADRHCNARRTGSLQLGVLGLPAHVHRVGPHLGTTVRFVRATADVHHRDRHLPHRLDDVGRRHVDADAHRVARDSRPGHGRDHSPQHDDCRRALYARRTRSHAGAVQRCLGSCLRGRPSRGRLHHRRPVMALGLLSEPPVRAHLHDRSHAGVPSRAPQLRRSGRLAGRNAALYRNQCAAAGPWGRRGQRGVVVRRRVGRAARPFL